ncbi:hypothetical protein ONZ45_g10568 [Pleurotus djamor]|nr:hypothetical protein ONZ45_g10568 [Pleurotus djamor]
MGRSQANPLFILTPYLLCALAVASNYPSIRKTTFAALTGIVTYVVHFTTFGKPEDDFGNACLLVGLAFTASDILLINNPLVELRAGGQKVSAVSLSFYSRFKWALHLLTSPRRVGWTDEPTDVLPPPPKQKTNAAYAAYLLLQLGINILLVDLVGTALNRFPLVFLDPSRGDALYGFSWVYRSAYVALFGYCQYVTLSAAHTVWMLVLTATGRWEPSQFRPLFGSWKQAYTVRKFWGRTWHQLLRRIFKAHGDLVTKRILGLPTKGRFTSYTQLYIAFILSGVIHYWAELMPVGHWHSHSVRFFLIQAAGVHCEDIVIAIASRLGFRESLFWRIVGYVWILQWFTWSVPFWLHAPAQGAEVGIVKLVCSTLPNECPSILSSI